MTDIEQFVAQELKIDLQSDEVATRRHALLTLSKYMKHKDVVELIEGVAKEDADEELRYLARKCLDEYRKSATKKETNARPVGGSIVKGIFTYGDREAKLDVIKKVMAMGSDGELPVILEYLDEEDDTWVIASLVKAVGVLGSVSHIPRLQPFLEHDDPRVQANAIEALEAIGDDCVVPLIIPMLAKQDNRIRANAIKALISYDKEQALSTLEAMALSRKAWQRDSALYCFSIITDYEPSELVIKMLSAETESGLMKKEAEVLGQRGDENALSELSEIAASKDRDKAVLARFAMNQIRERFPDAVEKKKQRQKMSKEEAEKRVARLMQQEAQTEARANGAIWPAIALACVVLFVFLGGYAYHRGQKSDLKRLTQRASSNKPDRSGPDLRGEFIIVQGKIENVDQAASKMLIFSKGSRVLCEVKATESQWKKARIGAKAIVEAEVTGKTRFGGLYAKGTLTKISDS